LCPRSASAGSGQTPTSGPNRTGPEARQRTPVRADILPASVGRSIRSRSRCWNPQWLELGNMRGDRGADDLRHGLVVDCWHGRKFVGLVSGQPNCRALVAMVIVCPFEQDLVGRKAPSSPGALSLGAHGRGAVRSAVCRAIGARHPVHRP
jgi:hypothetical protein